MRTRLWVRHTTSIYLLYMVISSYSKHWFRQIQYMSWSAWWFRTDITQQPLLRWIHSSTRASCLLGALCTPYCNSLLRTVHEHFYGLLLFALTIAYGMYSSKDSSAQINTYQCIKHMYTNRKKIVYTFDGLSIHSCVRIFSFYVVFCLLLPLLDLSDSN